MLDYIVEQEPCNTIQTVGRIFGRVGYGLGLQKNSIFNEELSMHILQLRETGYMDELKVKWCVLHARCKGLICTGDLILSYTLYTIQLYFHVMERK